MRDEARPHEVRFGGANSRAIQAHEQSTVDAVFDALAEGRRRTVVEHVFGQAEWVGLEELADLVESPVAATDGGTPTFDPHDRVRCRLYHSDLPKLDDAGVVEFDREANRVRPTSDDDRLDLCLAVMARAG